MQNFQTDWPTNKIPEKTNPKCEHLIHKTKNIIEENETIG